MMFFSNQQKLNNMLLEEIYNYNSSYQKSKVKKLIKKGADVNTKDEEGRTALHLAARFGYLKVFDTLLATDIDLNAKDNRGWTALHYAAFFDHLKIIKKLIRAGADMETKDYVAWTALRVASCYEKKFILKELLIQGAVVDLQSLAKYPKKTIPYVHKQMNMETMWYSVLFFILKERKKHSKVNFKKYIQMFLVKTTDIPDTIKIIINCLI